MPIITSTFKSAVLACLEHNGLTTAEVIRQLLQLKRGAALTFRDIEGTSYSYHVLGQSVNFELWARRGMEPIAYEIAFFSDH